MTNMTNNTKPRIPWTPEEDAAIGATYAQANGAFPTYAQQARDLNEEFHEGRPVRTASSVKTREGVVVFNKPTRPARKEK